MIINIRKAQYRSPSGLEFDLEWQAVSRSSGHAVATGDYPQYDGGDVLDLGHTIEQYPFQCFFYGENFQRRADAFYAALLEHGIAVLTHPRWGILSVIPTSISQNEDYVESIGKVTFDITFVVAGETLDGQEIAGDEQIVVESAKAARTSLIERLLNWRVNTAVFDRFNQAILLPLKLINSITGNGWRLASAWQGSVNTLEMALNGIFAAPQSAVNLVDGFLLPIKQIGKGEKFGFLRSTKKSLTPTSSANQRANRQFESTDEANARINGTLVSSSLLTIAAIELAMDLNNELSDRSEAGELLLLIGALESQYWQSMDELFADVTIMSQGMDMQLASAIMRMMSVAKEAVLQRMQRLKLIARRSLAHDMSSYEALYLLYARVDEAELEQFISLNNLNDEQVFLLSAGTEIKYYAR